MYLHKLNSYLLILSPVHSNIYKTAENLFYTYRKKERERLTGHMQTPIDKTHKPSSMRQDEDEDRVGGRMTSQKGSPDPNQSNTLKPIHQFAYNPLSS